MDFISIYSKQVEYSINDSFLVFDPEGPLWIQVVDPENGEESNDAAIKDNADNELSNANKAKNNTEEEEELEPPSPSKPAYENTACLQKKRINNE